MSRSSHYERELSRYRSMIQEDMTSSIEPHFYDRFAMPDYTSMGATGGRAGDGPVQEPMPLLELAKPPEPIQHPGVTPDTFVGPLDTESPYGPLTIAQQDYYSGQQALQEYRDSYWARKIQGAGFNPKDFADMLSQYQGSQPDQAALHYTEDPWANKGPGTPRLINIAEAVDILGKKMNLSNPAEILNPNSPIHQAIHKSVRSVEGLAASQMTTDLMLARGGTQQIYEEEGLPNKQDQEHVGFYDASMHRLGQFVSWLSGQSGPFGGEGYIDQSETSRRLAAQNRVGIIRRSGVDSLIADNDFTLGMRAVGDIMEPSAWKALATGDIRTDEEKGDAERFVETTGDLASWVIPGAGGRVLARFAGRGAERVLAREAGKTGLKSGLKRGTANVFKFGAKGGTTPLGKAGHIASDLLVMETVEELPNLHVLAEDISREEGIPYKQAFKQAGKLMGEDLARQVTGIFSSETKPHEKLMAAAILLGVGTATYGGYAEIKHDLKNKGVEKIIGMKLDNMSLQAQVQLQKVVNGIANEASPEVKEAAIKRLQSKAETDPNLMEIMRIMGIAEAVEVKAENDPAWVDKDTRAQIDMEKGVITLRKHGQNDVSMTVQEFTHELGHAVEKKLGMEDLSTVLTVEEVKDLQATTTDYYELTRGDDYDAVEAEHILDDKEIGRFWLEEYLMMSEKKRKQARKKSPSVAKLFDALDAANADIYADITVSSEHFMTDGYGGLKGDRSNLKLGTHKLVDGQPVHESPKMETQMFWAKQPAPPLPDGSKRAKTAPDWAGDTDLPLDAEAMKERVDQYEEDFSQAELETVQEGFSEDADAALEQAQNIRAEGGNEFEAKLWEATSEAMEQTIRAGFEGLDFIRYSNRGQQPQKGSIDWHARQLWLGRDAQGRPKKMPIEFKDQLEEAVGREIPQKRAEQAWAEAHRARPPKGVDPSEYIEPVDDKQADKNYRLMAGEASTGIGPTNPLTRFESAPVNGKRQLWHFGDKQFEHWMEETQNNLSRSQVRGFKNWYSGMVPMFDERGYTPRHVAAWAVLNMRRSTDSSLRIMFNIMDQEAGFNLDAPPEMGQYKGEDLLAGGKVQFKDDAKLVDFINSSHGRHTREFMGDDPAGKEPFVADVHTTTDRGYISPVILKMLTDPKKQWMRGKLNGKKIVSAEQLDMVEVRPKTETTPAVMAPTRAIFHLEDGSQLELHADATWDGGQPPTKKHYQEIVEWGNRVTEQLIADGRYGKRGWDPAAVQAVGWMNVLNRRGEPFQTPDWMFRRHTSVDPAEMVFGANSPIAAVYKGHWDTLTPDQQAKMTSYVLERTAAEIAMMINGSLRLFGKKMGHGLWQGNVSPNMIFETVGSLPARKAFAAALAYVTQQTGVYEIKWERGTNSKGIFLSYKNGDPLTIEDVQDLLEFSEENGTGWLLGKETGATYMEIDTGYAHFFGSPAATSRKNYEETKEGKPEPERRPLFGGREEILAHRDSQAAKVERKYRSSFTESQLDQVRSVIDAWAKDRGIEVQASGQRHESEYYEHDWKADPEGRPHLERYINSGPAQARGRLVDHRRRYAETIEDGFKVVKAELEQSGRQDRVNWSTRKKRSIGPRYSKRGSEGRAKLGVATARQRLREDVTAYDQARWRNPNHRAWFGKSKVVDVKGQPLKVLHGTVHDWQDPQFRRGQRKTGYSKWWGDHFYFTDSTADVDANYADEQGPDLKAQTLAVAQKLVNDYRRAWLGEGRTSQEWDAFIKKMMDDGTVGDFQQQFFTDARSHLAIQGGHVLPVELSLQNPVIMGDIDQTQFGTTEAGDGLGDKYAAAFQKLAEFDLEGPGGVMPAEAQAAVDDYLTHALRKPDDEGLNAHELLERLEQMYPINSFIRDPQNFFTSVLQEMGFDGIIDSNVGHTLKKMPGVDWGTTHYVAFKPTQVKSVFNDGTYGTQDPNILQSRRSTKPLTEYSPEFQEDFKGSKVVNAEGHPLLLYRGAKGAHLIKSGNSITNSPSFTTDPAIASMYAGKAAPPDVMDVHHNYVPVRRIRVPAVEPQVAPVYLNIKNPLDLRRFGSAMSLGDFFDAVGMEPDWLSTIAEELAERHNTHMNALNPTFWSEFKLSGEFHDISEFHDTLERMEGEQDLSPEQYRLMADKLTVDVFAIIDDQNVQEHLYDEGYDGAVYNDAFLEVPEGAQDIKDTPMSYADPLKTKGEKSEKTFEAWRTFAGEHQIISGFRQSKRGAAPEGMTHRFFKLAEQGKFPMVWKDIEAQPERPKIDKRTGEPMTYPGGPREGQPIMLPAVEFKSAREQFMDAMEKEGISDAELRFAGIADAVESLTANGGALSLEQIVDLADTNSKANAWQIKVFQETIDQSGSEPHSGFAVTPDGVDTRGTNYNDGWEYGDQGYPLVPHEEQDTSEQWRMAEDFETNVVNVYADQWQGVHYATALYRDHRPVWKSENLLDNSYVKHWVENLPEGVTLPSDVRALVKGGLNTDLTVDQVNREIKVDAYALRALMHLQALAQRQPAGDQGDWPQAMYTPEFAPLRYQASTPRGQVELPDISRLATKVAGTRAGEITPEKNTYYLMKILMMSAKMDPVSGEKMAKIDFGASNSVWDHVTALQSHGSSINPQDAPSPVQAKLVEAWDDASPLGLVDMMVRDSQAGITSTNYIGEWSDFLDSIGYSVYDPLPYGGIGAQAAQDIKQHGVATNFASDGGDPGSVGQYNLTPYDSPSSKYIFAYHGDYAHEPSGVSALPGGRVYTERVAVMPKSLVSDDVTANHLFADIPKNRNHGWIRTEVVGTVESGGKKRVLMAHEYQDDMQTNSQKAAGHREDYENLMRFKDALIGDGTNHHPDASHVRELFENIMTGDIYGRDMLKLLDERVFEQDDLFEVFDATGKAKLGSQRGYVDTVEAAITAWEKINWDGRMNMTSTSPLHWLVEKIDRIAKTKPHGISPLNAEQATRLKVKDQVVDTVHKHIADEGLTEGALFPNGDFIAKTGEQDRVSAVATEAEVVIETTFTEQDGYITTAKVRATKGRGYSGTTEIGFGGATATYDITSKSSQETLAKYGPDDHIKALQAALEMHKADIEANGDPAATTKGTYTVSGKWVRSGRKQTHITYDIMIPKMIKEVGRIYGVKPETRTVELRGVKHEMPFLPLTPEMVQDVMELEGMSPFSRRSVRGNRRGGSPRKLSLGERLRRALFGPMSVMKNRVDVEVGSPTEPPLDLGVSEAPTEAPTRTRQQDYSADFDEAEADTRRAAQTGTDGGTRSLEDTSARYGMPDRERAYRGAEEIYEGVESHRAALDSGAVEHQANDIISNWMRMNPSLDTPPPIAEIIVMLEEQLHAIQIQKRDLLTQIASEEAAVSWMDSGEHNRLGALQAELDSMNALQEKVMQVRYKWSNETGRGLWTHRTTADTIGGKPDLWIQYARNAVQRRLTPEQISLIRAQGESMAELEAQVEAERQATYNEANRQVTEVLKGFDSDTITLQDLEGC